MLHQMPPLVDLSLIIALDFAVGFGRDHGGCTALVEILQKPVRIEGFVREQGVERIASDQRRDTFHIMRLSRHQRHDCRCQPPARAHNCLGQDPLTDWVYRAVMIHDL